MLQARNPEKVYLSRIEERQVKRLDRLERLTNRATVTLAVAAVALGAYWSDVNVHEQVEANASSHINVLNGPLDKTNDDSSLIFFDGFGSYDANGLTRDLDPAARQLIDGSEGSVSYANAPLSPEIISQQTIDLAKQHGWDKISIVGYSTGGLIGSEVAADIVEHSTLQLEAMYLISTPNGTGGLRAARADEMKVADIVAHIPGAQYSSLVRFIGEVYSRRDQFIHTHTVDPGDLWDTVGNVIHDMNNKNLPGTWLLIDQTLAIAHTDMKDNLDTIGKSDATHRKPIIIYLGTAKPGYDYMVNNQKSSKEICLDAKHAGLPCFVYNVPGAVHTRPDLSIKAYEKTIKDALPTLQAALANQAMTYSIVNEKIVTRVSGVSG